jgi:hypothetical protein
MSRIARKVIGVFRKLLSILTAAAGQRLVPAGAAGPPGSPAGTADPGIPPGQLPRPPRRRVPRWTGWAVLAMVAGLVFRRAVAAVVLTALSAVLEFAGVDVHLPHIRLTWPWQRSTATTTNASVGPWVLQKIEGISRPALGTVTFSFVFTHKVSRSIAFWPCWYASTFSAVGHASATVDLNPGPGWWARGAGHYQLSVLRAPSRGRPGQVTVRMVLPRPELPQSVHDVTIDDIPSRPIDIQHSWTYPGLGCGAVLRPQFPQSVLYAEAQQIAYWRSTHVPQVTRELIGSAEAEAAQTIRDSFIQPTLNALGYRLAGFSLGWAAGPATGGASAAGGPVP